MTQDTDNNDLPPISPFDNPVGYLLHQGSSQVAALTGLLKKFGLDDINQQLPLPTSYREGVFKPLDGEEPSSWSYLETYLFTARDDATYKASAFKLPLSQENIDTWSPSVISSLLVEMGADTNVTGSYLIKRLSDQPIKWDILDLAFDRGHYGFCHAMLCDGGPLEHLRPTLNTRVKGGNTWLYVACQDKDTDWMETLLKWGCDPNAQNSDGDAPLFVATTPQDVALLAAHGASPTLKNKMGKTCEQRWEQTISLASQRVKMSRLLLSNASDEMDDNQWNSLRSKWFLDLPFSTKTVSAPLASKLKIGQDYLYQSNGVSISPLTWMAHHAIHNEDQVSKKAGLWNWACTTFTTQHPFSDRATNQQVLGALLMAGVNHNQYYYASEGLTSIRHSVKPVLDAMASSITKHIQDPQEVGVELARQLCVGALESMNIPMVFKSSYKNKEPYGHTNKEAAMLLHRLLTLDVLNINPKGPANHPTLVDHLEKVWPESAGDLCASFALLRARDPDLHLEMSVGACQSQEGFVFQSINCDVYKTAMGCIPLIERCAQNPTPEETRALLSLLVGSSLENVDLKYSRNLHAPLIEMDQHSYVGPNPASTNPHVQFKNKVDQGFELIFQNPQWVQSVDQETWSAWDARAQRLQSSLSDMRNCPNPSLVSELCKFVMQQQYLRHLDVEDNNAPKARRKM